MKMLKYFVTFCVFQLAAGACQSGWIGHGGSCYHFSHDMEYWTGAFEMCKIIGGQLLEINDEMENNFAASQATLTGREYWISLSDVVEENRWIWMTSKEEPSYTNWDQGEPTVKFNGQYENCVDMHSTGKWNDVTCTTKKYYVCEQDNRDMYVHDAPSEKANCFAGFECVYYAPPEKGFIVLQVSVCPYTSQCPDDNSRTPRYNISALIWELVIIGKTIDIGQQKTVGHWISDYCYMDLTHEICFCSMSNPTVTGSKAMFT